MVTRLLTDAAVDAPTLAAAMQLAAAQHVAALAAEARVAQQLRFQLQRLAATLVVTDAAQVAEATLVAKPATAATTIAARLLS